MFRLLEEQGEIESYSSGDSIEGDSLGIVIFGHVVITSEGEQDKEIILNIVGPSGVFRAATVFGRIHMQPTRIHARGKTKILVIKTELLERMLSGSPILLRNYMAFLAERIIFLNKKIQTLAGGTVEDRILLYLGDRFNRTGSQTIELPMKVGELAASLNVSRASFYRALDELEAKGIIKRSGKNITINMPETLSKNSVLMPRAKRTGKNINNGSDEN
jgi:CRP-like cAMP-binding protein